MPQDAFTLRYLCSELNEVFKGGKINRIVQPSNDETIMTVYTGKRTVKFLLNVNPASPRIGIIEEEMESPLTAPAFCMLMRKHLLSATITNVELIGFDRIVKIDFMASGEFFDSVKKTLYVELMGRYSNIILTEDGKILGGNRGINMFDNGVRPLIVGKEYIFPPVGEKRLPSNTELVSIFDEIDKDSIADCVCKNVQGIAFSTAYEIQKNFEVENSDCVTKFGKRLYDFLLNYLYQSPKKPCVIIENNQVKDVCVYPYKTISGEIKEFNSLCMAEDYFFREKERIKRFNNKRERLNAIANSAIKKAKKRIVAITSKERDALCAEDNRIKGELILANIYKFKGGETECVLDNYYDGTKIKISLDSRLSASKNAEAYYKKYNKQKRTLLALAPQKEQAEKELNYYTSVLDEVLIAENIEELNLVQNELENYGLIVEKRFTNKKKEDVSFCHEYYVNGFNVLVGRNNIENDKLTFTAKPFDLWVHLKNQHSSHVIIRSKGREVPEEIITIACQICAYYSKDRECGKTECVYTLKKNVKKPPKSKPGFCVYENFKSVMVEPQKHAEFLKTR